MMRRFAIALTLLCATGCVSLARAQAAAAPAAQTEAPANPLLQKTTTVTATTGSAVLAGRTPVLLI